MTLALRTMHDRVLVRKVAHVVSDGGILIPQHAQPNSAEWYGARTIRGEYTVEGEVIAVGPGPECVEPREIAGLVTAAGIALEEWEAVRDSAVVAAAIDRVGVRIGETIRSLRAASTPSADVRPGDRVFWPSWVQKWETRIDVGGPDGAEDLVEIKGDDLVAVMRDGEIVPLRHRILVHHERVPDRLGRFYVPEDAQKKTFWARVAAVGAGRILRDGKRVPNDVKVGDRVYLFEHGETRITINGADNIVMRIDDVLAVDEDPPALARIEVVPVELDAIGQLVGAVPQPVAEPEPAVYADGMPMITFGRSTT